MDQPLSELGEDRVPQDVSTVFMIEDDEATREAVSAFLSGRGYTVRSFESCEAFLAAVPEVEGDCLLLDYHFDGMTGFGLLDKLRARNQSRPTILYTGRFDGNIKRRAAGYEEVVSFLRKPLGGPVLLEALDTAFKQA